MAETLRNRKKSVYLKALHKNIWIILYINNFIFTRWPNYKFTLLCIPLAWFVNWICKYNVQCNNLSVYLILEWKLLIQKQYRIYQNWTYPQVLNNFSGMDILFRTKNYHNHLSDTIRSNTKPWFISNNHGTYCTYISNDDDSFP